MTNRGRPLLLAILASFTLLGCPDAPEQQPTPQPGARSSSALHGPRVPEAELIPAPLAHPPAGSDSGPADVSSDAASASDHAQLAPRPLREDRPVAPDPLRGPEAVGISLEAQWQWQATPGPYSGPEVDKTAVAAARARAAFTLAVDVSPLGRMRLSFTGLAFPLPRNTQLRARDDRYGHVLLWPDERRYRVLPSGTLRALLQEHRTDVLPALSATVEEQSPGFLLGFETTRSQLATELGKVMLEQAAVPGAGAGAPLLCRLLVELVAAQPSSPACREGLLPLRADYQWPVGGKASFVVSAVLRGQQLRLEDLMVPPPSATFRADGLPGRLTANVFSRGQLARLRTRDVEPAQPAEPGAPQTGVLAVNRSETLQYLLLDGLPVCWVKPMSEQHVQGLRPGRYTVSWRDPLGTTTQPTRTLDIPARLVVGEEPDGGTAEH
jgi:hypothetical protein